MKKREAQTLMAAARHAVDARAPKAEATTFTIPIHMPIRFIEDPAAQHGVTP